MSEQKTQSKAEARRERNSEANHIGMDTAAAGMAAGGLGLALLHQQTSEAKALTGETRYAADPAVAMGDRPIDGQPERAADHVTLADDHRSEQAPVFSETGAESHIEASLAREPTDTGSRAGTHQDHGSSLQVSVTSGLEPIEGGPSASGPTSSDQSEIGALAASGLQNLLSGASSAVADIAHGLEQRLDAFTSATSEAIDASLSAVSHQLSSLTSRIGDLVADHGENLSHTVSATTDTVGNLAGDAIAAAPAVVDPVFHQAFGPASDIHSFADVVDTSGLASFGSTAQDMPIPFLGQSYTELADHTVHGLQGLTHGLV